MFGLIINWLRGLSIVGRTVVGLTTLGVAGAVVSPNVPSTPSVKTETVQVKTSQVITNKVITETKEIPFSKKTEEDSSLAEGTKMLKTIGVLGIKTLSYNVIYTDDIETKRELIKEETTTKPIDEITLIGTYVEPAPVYVEPQLEPAARSSNCDPNYSGGCVPNVSYDLDCPDIGFTVQVIGTDHHRFDRDGDGYGCESY